MVEISAMCQKFLDHNIQNFIPHLFYIHNFSLWVAERAKTKIFGKIGRNFCQIAEISAWAYPESNSEQKKYFMMENWKKLPGGGIRSISIPGNFISGFLIINGTYNCRTKMIFAPIEIAQCQSWIGTKITSVYDIFLWEKSLGMKLQKIEISLEKWSLGSEHNADGCG